MADVAYRSWSLIPRDLQPTQQDPSFKQPPMLTTIALDPGGSLHFELASDPQVVQVQVTVTALTAEGRSGSFLRVFRGEEGAYAAVEVEWSRGQDGPHAIFTADVGGRGRRLKLHLAQGLALIVTTIQFGA